MKKIEIRSIPAKVADTLHPSNVTWLSAKETTKRTGCDSLRGSCFCCIYGFSRYAVRCSIEICDLKGAFGI